MFHRFHSRNISVRSRRAGLAFLAMLLFSAGGIWGNTPAPDLEDRAAQLEQTFREHGLVDAGSMSELIRVDLKYASTANFMGESVYGSLNRCWLAPEAARKLVLAAAILEDRHPGYRLVVLDGARPRSVQRRMWNLVRNTPKQPYVANPAGVSMHNFGLAVDITIADETGARLDMGTAPDYFGALAQPQLEARFLREGKLNPAQVSNRHLLRGVMTGVGFIPLELEWWHFNAMDLKTARALYPIIE